MIYMKITKTHYSDMSLKLPTISDDTLIPLRIKNNVAMHDYVIEVVNV